MSTNTNHLPQEEVQALQSILGTDRSQDTGETIQEDTKIVPGANTKHLPSKEVEALASIFETQDSEEGSTEKVSESAGAAASQTQLVEAPQPSLDKNKGNSKGFQGNAVRVVAASAVPISVSDKALDRILAGEDPAKVVEDIVEDNKDDSRPDPQS